MLVEMDADGSHAPDALQRLLGAVDAWCHLAIGSRYVAETVRNWPWRRSLSKTANLFAWRSGIGFTTSPLATARTARSTRSGDLDGVDSGATLPDRSPGARVSNGFVVTGCRLPLPSAKLGIVQDERVQHSWALVKVARWASRTPFAPDLRARPDVARPGAGGSRSAAPT